MANRKLAGKVAIVTGASRGIGAAIAKRLAVDGAKVVVNYNSSPERANEVVADIEKAGGVAVVVKSDISDPGQIAGLFDAAEESFGTVTLLVNNAAVPGEPMPVPAIGLAHYEKLFHTNVRGPILCIAEFARRVGSGGGRIVNMTSGQSRTPMPGVGLYAGTKGALEAITRAFAADLGPNGVTVNAVAPGATRTDEFMYAVAEDVKEQTLKNTVNNTALGRLGTPEDIADVVAFLMSDDARWVTGQVLDANGGLRRS